MLFCDLLYLFYFFLQWINFYSFLTYFSVVLPQYFPFINLDSSVFVILQGYVEVSVVVPVSDFQINIYILSGEAPGSRCISVQGLIQG
jgi:hypothetical protein